MIPMLLGAAGFLLCVAALFVVVLFVVAPAGPRIPAERRRAPGAVRVSSISRFANATTGLIERGMSRNGRPTFAMKLELAGVKSSPAGYVLLVICATVVLGAIGVLVGGLTLLSVLTGPLFAVLALIASNVILSIRTARRRAAFADQLDDTLGLISGGLRAGHSLLRALDGISQDVESPTREEFARVVNETRIGRDLGDALHLTATRMQSDDFRWVAQAVAINQEAGGNLADVFDQTGRTIRERSEIRRQVKALSAEGRMSALVLLLLPVGVFLLVLLLRPSYYAGFFTNIFGIISMGIAVVLMVLGALWMRVMVRVKF